MIRGHPERSTRKGESRISGLVFWIGVFLGLSTFLAPHSSRAAECIPIETVGELTPEGADQPSDIALGPNGLLYLADGVNHRVLVLDRKGRVRFSFGKEGEGKGEFRLPKGIGISREGRILVADSGNGRIQVFDPEGNFLSLFPVGARPGERPAEPVDVLVSRLSGEILVSDNANHRIAVFDPEGRPRGGWGRFGEGELEFRYPGLLTQSDFNEIFVVDVINSRVQKLDPAGNFVAEIGAFGVFPGRLFRPKGVAVDEGNRAFVGDSYLGLVQAFTDLGRFLGVLCEGGKKRTFTTPVGMAYEAGKKRLYLVEMRANRITVVRILD